MSVGMDHGMNFCMNGTSAKNNSWTVMDSTYDYVDTWRNIGNLKAMSLCCANTGGSDVS